jgi:hypothetical protein
MTLDPILSPEQAKIGLDQLSIAGLEVDHAAPGDKTSIGRRQAHDVGHFV